jgi:hypothetical protein
VPIRRATALLAALALLAMPAAACADGDPASDILLTSDDYVPYFPAATKQLDATLAQLLKQTRKNGYRMKVAVIAGRGDLGAYPDLFNQPQRYANLLAKEIAFAVRKPHLLVVMPGGFAGLNLGNDVDKTLSGVRITTSPRDSNGLVQAAIDAVAKLAAANGHPTAIPKVKGASSSSGGSSSHTGQYLGAGLFALCGLGLVAVATRHRRTKTT